MAKDFEKSLGDQVTFGGKDRGASEKDTAQSLGDQITVGGGDAIVGEALDDGMEVVDLSARYKVESTLGKGGMGEVVLATDTRLERKVAIKRILGEAARSRAAVNRFLTEAKSIAALNHPNIVQIYDYGRATDGPFLIMEYVAGSSLLDRCRRRPLPLEEAVDLTCQLCDGLAKAHDAGIVHRDIKPANVLMTVDGIPKLTDFGLAKAESADTGMTMAGAVLGTLDFMSPEQRRDAALVDARSDLWALAATLYQVVTGKSPKIIRFNDVPRSLHTVLGKALEDKKEDRYQTAREFRDALFASQRAAVSIEAELEEGDCPHCGTKNPTNRKFCRNPVCGQSLEVPCRSCKSKIPMWEQVCDSCGAKQGELLEQRRSQMASNQSEAESLLKSHDFEKAAKLAEALRDEKDLRLQHLKGWAESFLPQIEKGRRQELARIAGLMDEALAHQKAHDYAAGLRTLAHVPESLANLSVPGHVQTVSGLKQQLQGSFNEIQRLNKLIHTRVKQRELNGLLAAVDQLLALCPEEPKVVKLKKQLLDREVRLRETRNEAFTEAKNLFQSQDWDGCLREIARIDDTLVDDEIKALRQQATSSREELQQLRQTIADRVKSKELSGLLPQVESALKLQSAAEDLQKLRQQLIEREQKNAVAVAGILENAKALRQSCQFGAAADALQRIPEELAAEESNKLLLDCQNMAWSQSEATQALQTAMRTENYRHGLSNAEGYRNALANTGLTDESFAQAYAACQSGLQAKQAEGEAVRRRNTLLIRVGMGAAGVVFLLLVLWVVLAVRSSTRASALAIAIQRQRWDEALVLDPDNLEALIGRATSRLAGNSPNLEGAFADLKRAEELDPDAEGLRSAKAFGHATRAKSLADAGKTVDAEKELLQAKSLDSAEPTLVEVSQRLAMAYIKDAETAFRTGESIQVAAKVAKALEYNASVTIPTEIVDSLEKAEADRKFAAAIADAERVLSLPPIRNSIGMELKLLPAGTFTMGSTKGAKDEQRLNQVTLTKPFYLGVTEITQELYERVMGENRSLFKGSKYPADQVSWNDAVEFCRKLSELPEEKAAGRTYRLPTEAEWEYACRARTTTEYSFGDDDAQLADHAWYAKNSSGETQPIGQKKPNPWGLYDMHGNVKEWCADWYGDNLVSNVINPTGPTEGSRRVLRGGSWNIGEMSCRSAKRDWGNPSLRYSMHGFRVSFGPTTPIGSSAKSVPSERPTENTNSTLTKSDTNESDLGELTNTIGMKLKRLPAGAFAMGKRNETRWVTLSKPFYFGVTEVTQEQYERVMGSNPSNFKGQKNPVEKVSWEEAVDFCRKLSALPEEKVAGRVYRLPSEAEWEYACQAGTTTKYSFGNDERLLGEYAWYSRNSGNATHPVGQKKPNVWGVHDMHGNVWEWCQDWHGDFPKIAETDPTGPSNGSSRVLRGGCWDCVPSLCRSVIRDGRSPTDRSNFYGFRVALDPPKKGN